MVIACILVLDTTGLAGFALLCAAFHECGHILALKVYHVPVEEISFKVFGMSMKLKSNTRISYKQEVAVALAGCTVNAVLALIFYLIALFGIAPQITGTIFLFNLALAGFNLLPIMPLDGGRALENLLLRKLQYTTVYHIMNILSAVLLFPLVCIGVLFIIQSGYNFTLIIAAAYLAVYLIFKEKLFKKSGKFHFGSGVDK